MLVLTSCWIEYYLDYLFCSFPIGIIYLTLTIMSINTSLSKWDILSFSSYKYVGIIAVLISGLLLNTKGYYIGWIYVSIAYMFFLLRTLKLRIEPEVISSQRLLKKSEKKWFKEKISINYLYVALIFRFMECKFMENENYISFYCMPFYSPFLFTGWLTPWFH